SPPSRGRLLPTLVLAGADAAQRDVERQGLARRLRAFGRLLRAAALLRTPGAVAAEDLQRRHHRRLLEEAAVGLGRHAHGRADALAADEHGVAQHVSGVRDRMGDDVVLAHLEAPALYGRDAHATALRLAGLTAAGLTVFRPLPVFGRTFRISSHRPTISVSPRRCAFSRNWRISGVVRASIRSLVHAAERPGCTSLIINIAFRS